MPFFEPLFRDRRDAGRQLAAAWAAYRQDRPVVLALPRGGVPVGFEVAKALTAPLDVLLVRKIGAPGHEELGLGAVVDSGLSDLYRTQKSPKLIGFGLLSAGICESLIIWLRGKDLHLRPSGYEPDDGHVPMAMGMPMR